MRYSSLFFGQLWRPVFGFVLGIAMLCWSIIAHEYIEQHNTQMKTRDYYSSHEGERRAMAKIVAKAIITECGNGQPGNSLVTESCRTALLAAEEVFTRPEEPAR